MSTGDIKFSNGKELHWHSQMPSYEILYKFKKIITNKEKIEKKKEKEKYLPIKTLRKVKLDKLKNIR